MRRCSVSMRNRRFKPWTGSIRCCRCRVGEPSVTASNTIAMARCRSTPLWMCEAAGCTAKRPPATPATSLWIFSSKWLGCAKPKQEIHVILDNLSAHKTQKVTSFLQKHPNVKLHFTPTYSSWLNQVEIWFSRIERDLLARGIFTSVADLARKIRRYIHRYNKAPKPIRWAYRNPAHRIGSTSMSTVH